ncbi:hypothetical protein OH491_16730 [Termitidicoccus mucosus]|uniref:Uncharacterized protein n=1 Tax=Termitidicoccus mucosus TaxID=1184151 RepID=A0A178IKE7_9BACT|nr:hypothetical protein AW736_11865 [Opitutaceae bacterium TSB47]
MTSDTTVSIENAEIIYEKPPSGAFEEVLFGSDRGNTLWVRFSDRDGAAEWIGKFGCGVSTSMRVTKAVEPDRFMVVAGGAAYLVDATRRQLLNQHIDAFVQDIAYDSKRNHFIAADVRLRIIEGGHEVWASKRVSIDDIHGLRVDGRVLSGTAVVGYEGEEEPFSFDLDSREFLTGPDFSSWDVPAPSAKPKPWWRFWK